MIPPPDSPPDTQSVLEALPLSLLNDLLYCPRRAALKAVEGWREANVHTVRGDIVHEHADLPGAPLRADGQGFHRTGGHP